MQALLISVNTILAEVYMAFRLSGRSPWRCYVFPSVSLFCKSVISICICTRTWSV